MSTDHADKPVGYLLVEVVDGDAQIEQVSVHPDDAHRRIGRSLVDVGAAWAQHHGLAALTLTTYAEVPWNAPYCRRLGFGSYPPTNWVLISAMFGVRRQLAASTGSPVSLCEGRRTLTGATPARMSAILAGLSPVRGAEPFDGAGFRGGLSQERVSGPLTIRR